MPDDTLIENPASSETEIPMADTAAAATESPVLAAAAAPAQVLYVGPRLLRPFPVGPRTIYRGPLPVPLAMAVAADPDLAALFVPVADAGQALRTVAMPGTALARAATAVSAKYLRKEA
ncbi:hypothetical protein [Solidesulfovibrio sp.]